MSDCNIILSNFPQHFTFSETNTITTLLLILKAMLTGNKLFLVRLSGEFVLEHKYPIDTITLLHILCIMKMKKNTKKLPERSQTFSFVIFVVCCTYHTCP